MNEPPSERTLADVRSLWPCGGFPGGGVLDDEHCPHWQRDSLGLLTQHDLPAWGLPRAKLVAKHKTLNRCQQVPGPTKP